VNILPKIITRCEKLNNKAIQKLAESLKTLVCLQKISLNLAACRNVTGGSIEKLGKNLKFLNSLKEAKFDFSNKYTDSC